MPLTHKLVVAHLLHSCSQQNVCEKLMANDFDFALLNRHLEMRRSRPFNLQVATPGSSVRTCVCIIGV